MEARKPKIKNVWWRGEWAWGRIQYKGKPLREPLETTDPRVARDRVKTWIERLKASNWGQKARYTYDQAAYRFVKEHIPLLKGGVEGRTGKLYIATVDRLTEHFEGKHLDEIEAALSTYETKRRADGVAGGTIRGDLFVLSSIFSRAQEWYWVKDNPVRAYIRGRAKNKLLVAQPPRTRYCSHEEENEIIARCRASKTLRDGSARAEHTMLRAGIMLTIDLGLRLHELLLADWSMVDLERNEWFVPKELAKSSRDRWIPILPRSQELLKSLPRSNRIQRVLWHGERGGHKGYSDLLPALTNIATGGRSYVVRREMTKLAGKTVTDKDRARIAKMADEYEWAPEIPDLIWHDLRRTCGCRLLQDHGMAMEEVSVWLGHSSVKVTEQAYAFLNVRHLHAAVSRSRLMLKTARHETRLIGSDRPEDKPEISL